MDTKGNKGIKRRNNLHLNNLQQISFILGILSLFVNISLVKEVPINLISFSNSINLIVKGTGRRNFLSNSYHVDPSEVYINGNLCPTCNRTYNFIYEENNVTIIFGDTIKISEF